MRTLLAAAASLVLAAGAAQAASTPGFQASFWDASGWLGNIAGAESVIASRAADATFIASTIDYPNAGGSIVDSTTLSSFLGADAGSLSGFGGSDLTHSVFEFTGLVDLAAGAHTLTVGSDDGFALWINGDLVSSYDGNRSFGTTSASWISTGAPASIRLIYWENDGYTGVEFLADGALATAAALTPGNVTSDVPLPAAAPLLLCGLGAVAALRRGRKA